MNRKLIASSVISILGLSAHLEAQELTWHGFASQGIVQSNNSEFITNNDSVTAQLTELGVNTRLQLSSKVGVVGQAVYLNGGNRFEEGGRLDYLFIDWKLPELWGWNSSLNIGRFKNRHWLYSSTRDVPQTRPMAVLPQSVYSDSLRDVIIGSDGVDLRVFKYNNYGTWEVNWSYGSSPISQATTRALVAPDARGDAEQDFVHQASVFWQPDLLNWRVGFSYLDSDFRYDPAPDERYVQGSSSIQRYMFSLSYFSSKWEINSEIFREKQVNNGGLFDGFTSDRTAEGGYIHARYIVNPTTSLIAGVDTFDRDRSDRNGRRFEQLTMGLQPAFSGYMDSFMFGGRWDFDSNWRIQGEHQWVRGTARLNLLGTGEAIIDANEYWQMWSIQVMHWF